jgi:putative transcription factor
LNCDICGREIQGPAFRVKVEGAKMLVCSRCQRLGKPYQEEPSARPTPPLRVTVAPRAPHRKAPEVLREMGEVEVAEDFAERIRKQRMKMGLSQEELAKRVKEKLSLIQKIEIGKIAPDTKLCKELEHELRIKLLVAPKEVPSVPKTAAPTEVTLGDIIRIKDKSKAETPT